MNRFALSATGLSLLRRPSAPVEIDVTLDYWAGEARNPDLQLCIQFDCLFPVCLWLLVCQRHEYRLLRR